MNYNFSEITYPSRDGKNTIYACLYTPKFSTAKGIVQIVHGMVDYVERYEPLAEFLAGEGYIVAGNHHLGHGRSAASEEDLGFFGEDCSVDTILRDVHTFNRYLRDQFPTLPLVIFGHSMGSFISRLYIEKYPHSVKGAVIHGTSGPVKAVGMGKMLASMIIRTRGARYRSKFLTSIALSRYNSHFPKSEGHNAWLTRDAAAIAGHDDDPYSSFFFTASAYKDLFTMLASSNRREWFSSYPKALPTYVVSGSEDPVGKYGKGPEYVYKHLLMAGCEKLTFKIYSGARHELFLETNRDEFYRDLLCWLNENI
ncbi:MAG: alpha/beta fold hydrolase [Clostridia bacterium]|nr:alpha/beta fold hydrolase [Clostridia bacterium]